MRKEKCLKKCLFWEKITRKIHKKMGSPKNQMDKHYKIDKKFGAIYKSS